MPQRANRCSSAIYRRGTPRATGFTMAHFSSLPLLLLLRCNASNPLATFTSFTDYERCRSPFGATIDGRPASISSSARSITDSPDDRLCQGLALASPAAQLQGSPGTATIACAKDRLLPAPPRSFKDHLFLLASPQGCQLHSWTQLSAFGRRSVGELSLYPNLLKI